MRRAGRRCRVAQLRVVRAPGRGARGELGDGEVLVVAHAHARRDAREDLGAVGALLVLVRCQLGALGGGRGGDVAPVDVQPRGAAGARERGVAPALGELARAREHRGVLDGAALHPVPGEAVGVLDVLGDVGSGQLADGAGVGFDDDAGRGGWRGRCRGCRCRRRRSGRCAGR